MPRKDQGWVTFQTSEAERQLLEEICKVTQRTKTEVLRELLRGLQDSAPTGQAEPPPTSGVETPPRSPSSQEEAQVTIQNPLELNSNKRLKVSSRNIFKGTIKQMIKGPVSTEVTIEIEQRIELTSTITTTSAEALELQLGKTAYAVIKSSDVVIAME